MAAVIGADYQLLQLFLDEICSWALIYMITAGIGKERILYEKIQDII